MARIEGVDLPRNKRVEIALSYLFGIGPTRARTILASTKVNPDIRVKDLTESDLSLMRDYISKNYKVEGDLRREVQMNIKRLIEIGCYRGLRHRRNLPVHGQRTHQRPYAQRSQEDRCRSRPPPWVCEEIILMSQSSICDRETGPLSRGCPVAVRRPPRLSSNQIRIEKVVIGRNYGSKRTPNASYHNQRAK